MRKIYDNDYQNKVREKVLETIKTRKDIAEEANINYTYLTRFLSGEIHLGAESIEKLTNVIKLNP